jgi:hypothetical protein
MHTCTSPEIRTPKKCDACPIAGILIFEQANIPADNGFIMRVFDVHSNAHTFLVPVVCHFW